MRRPRIARHRWADWLIVPVLAFVFLAGRNGNDSLWMPVAAMALAALCIAHVADACRTGSVAARFHDIERNSDAIGFYAAVIFWATMGAVSTAVTAGMWFQWMKKIR